MKVFFGILRVLISQLSYDAVMYLSDLSVVLWENLYDVFMRMVFFVTVIVILLFDIWIFIVLYKWVDHPLVATFVIIGGILVIFFQVGGWINRKDIYAWFLNEWRRASNTYRRKNRLEN